MADLAMSGRPQPQEVAAILVALRLTARPAEAPERPRYRRPIILAHAGGGRAWRLASAGVV